VLPHLAVVNFLSGTAGGSKPEGLLGSDPEELRRSDLLYLVVECECDIVGIKECDQLATEDFWWVLYFLALIFAACDVKIGEFMTDSMTLNVVRDQNVIKKVLVMSFHIVLFEYILFGFRFSKIMSP